MILKVLFIQRKCRYEGELAPEAVACQDEYGDEENPEYLKSEFEKYQEYPDVESLAVVDIEISLHEMRKILKPVVQKIQGKVILPDIA